MSDTKKELEEWCRDIADKLASLAAGDVYDEENNTVISYRDRDPDIDYDDNNRYTTLYSCLEDNYGVKILVDLSGDDYYGAEICVAWGGPNIYINTRTSYIEGYWGFDEVKVPLGYETRDKIDDVIEDWRSCY